MGLLDRIIRKARKPDPWEAYVYKVAMNWYHQQGGRAPVGPSSDRDLWVACDDAYAALKDAEEQTDT